MKALIALLNGLLSLFNKWQRDQQSKEMQHEQDAINDNPGEYMAHHFGMPDAADATHAPQAEAGEHKDS